MLILNEKEKKPQPQQKQQIKELEILPNAKQFYILNDHALKYIEM